MSMISAAPLAIMSANLFVTVYAGLCLKMKSKSVLLMKNCPLQGPGPDFVAELIKDALWVKTFVVNTSV